MLRQPVSSSTLREIARPPRYYGCGRLGQLAYIIVEESSSTGSIDQWSAKEEEDAMTELCQVCEEECLVLCTSQSDHPLQSTCESQRQSQARGKHTPAVHRAGQQRCLLCGQTISSSDDESISEAETVTGEESHSTIDRVLWFSVGIAIIGVVSFYLGKFCWMNRRWK